MGQYYLLEEIAQGGMAKIYKGISYDMTGLKKTVVIKKILPHISASKEFIDSLVDEAKIAVNLSHGNIAQTYDLGRSGEDYFIVMEYVDGKSLSVIHKRCVAAGSLIPIPHLCHLMCELLSGLDYMHRRTDENGRPLHIVHRDISPQNIMVSFSGTLKIIDFGIAKSSFKTGSTDSGILKGKFSYMSPEQARGDPIDHRSDIFSVGIIFHEMLTGKRLFKAEDSRETIRNVRRAKVEPPSQIREGIPYELDRIVLKALAKNRRHRYAFASDMRDDLLKFLAVNYPDFKPSDVGEFVTGLFRDDIKRREKEEEEIKTPVQIFEKTTSALADESQFEETGHIKSGPDMKEFFLEEEEMEEVEKLPEERPVPEFAAAEEPAVAKKFRFAIWPPFFKKRKSTLFFAFVVVFLFLALAAVIKIYERKSAISTANKAEIFISTEPSDARVIIDGKLRGAFSPLTVKDLDVDEEHTIIVEKEGYQTQSRQFRLKTGEFLNFKFTLTPSLKPAFTLSVASNPPGAVIYLNDEETPYRTPAVIKEIETGKTYTLGLFLDGYKFWSKKFEARPNETQNFDIQLEINPGSISVSSQPSEALVIINGTPYGQTPTLIENLKPQKIYRVEIWHEGYETYEEEVKIDAGKTKEIHVTLKKLQNIRQQFESESLPQVSIEPQTQSEAQSQSIEEKQKPSIPLQTMPPAAP